MFMIAIVRLFSLGERWNVLFNKEIGGTFSLSLNGNILVIAIWYVYSPSEHV